MALRAQLETTIGNAEKVTPAAELLRVRNDERNQARLVPRMPATAPIQQDIWIRTATGRPHREIDTTGVSFERERRQSTQVKRREEF